MNYLNRLPLKLKRIVCEIGALADEMNVDVYLVGGAVRDLILKRNNFDLDLVCSGQSIVLAKKFASKHDAQVTVYKEFQTATVFLKNGLQVDFALCRKEGYESSGALPKISVGSLTEDLFRRDITINAMAIQINTKNCGVLIDEFGGLEGLKKKAIKILHPRSFYDDPTRILRVIRFEQRFGFKLDFVTRKLLKEALAEHVENKVKSPRYFQEFKKILNEKEPVKALIRLHSFGGLRFIDEKLSFDQVYLKKIIRGVLKIQKFKANLESVYLFYWIALTRKLSDAKMDVLIKRFQLSNYEKRIIQDSRESLACERSLLKINILRSEVYRCLSKFDEMAILYLYMHTNKKIVHSRIERFLKEDKTVKLKITGDDVLRFDVPEGQGVRSALEKVLWEKLDKRFSSKNEELKVLKQLLN